MSSPSVALFVFAHQDDEMAAASRIAFERARGTRVTCAFLTDGRTSRVSPEIRNLESLAVLASLDVLPADILFLGTELPIGDGKLVEHLDRALDSLEARLVGSSVDTVYCLAWEGGHQDHDASHLVAAAFARRRGLLGSCYELPLYRDSRTVVPFFRVFSPPETRDAWESRHLTLAEGLELSMLALSYGSQRISWLGLLPEAFLKLAILRRERIRRVDPERLRIRPNEGVLLYARRFGFPYERFERFATPFIDAHFPSEDESSGR